MDDGQAARTHGRRDVRRHAPSCGDDPLPTRCRRPGGPAADRPGRGVRSRALVGALAVAAALAFPGASLAARYTVGLRPAADPAAVAAAVERVTGKRPASLAPFRALSAEGSPRELRAIPGVAWVERDRVRRVAFVPTDPLAPR